MLFTALNSGILFRIKEKKKPAGVYISLLGLTHLSAEAGVSVLGLPKTGRGIHTAWLRLTGHH